MENVVFLDCETTGLDPDRHEIWELAIISNDNETEWQLPVDLTRADPTGLRIGRFYERRSIIQGWRWGVSQCHMVKYKGDEKFKPTEASLKVTAEDIALKLDGKHIVGAVPSFDVNFLTRFLNAHGQAATWHYHLVDVEAMVAGRLGIMPPWNSDDLSRAIDVVPDMFDRHTALGDARWAKAMYEAVIIHSRYEAINEKT